MKLFLHLARRALVAFLGSLVAVVGLFLMVEFAENSAALRGRGWLGSVMALYAYRAAVLAYQTAPAAMLLAAGVTASELRRTREYTAMRALGLGPWRVAMPVVALAVVVSCSLAWLGDDILVTAVARSEKILAERFHRGGPGRAGEQKRWFRGRGGRRVYNLRGGGASGFEGVTVLEVTPDFHLARRIDAARMVPGPKPGEWVLEQVSERRFHRAGEMALTYFPSKTYLFDEEAGAFAVRPGRPAQMRREVIGEQIELRRRLGLSTREFSLAWHYRLSSPLAGISAALVALGLALRRERKGHLTATLVEAVAVSLVFWGLQGLCWSLGLAGRLPPAAAAWAPDALFLAVGAVLTRRLA